MDNQVIDTKLRNDIINSLLFGLEMVEDLIESGADLDNNAQLLRRYNLIKATLINLGYKAM